MGMAGKEQIEELFTCFDQVGHDDDYDGDGDGHAKGHATKRKHSSEDGAEAKKKRTDNIRQKLFPEIDFLTISETQQCFHEVAYPKDNYRKLNDDDGVDAKQYKFELDEFQVSAINCLKNSQSVMVAAHTSAGKTVVAEYAIAMSLQKNQRVIYTTPIKALSNQKYRELQEEFKDVGLMTGDITINPTAGCLIMTTEILRSMLFKGSEITKEVAWVIFDEIHYMKDATRGVVWEETIVMLSDRVRYVFLSATIPNARNFAEWIAALHSQPCNVIYTEKRPTPLEHYICPIIGEGMFLVVNQQNQFNWRLLHKQIVGKFKKLSNQPIPSEKDFVFNVVNKMIAQNEAPLIVFSFSKRDCETFAKHMYKLNFNTEIEKKLAKEVFNNAIDLLNAEDKEIPQIKEMFMLVLNGIAYHHSGLLPIVKEIVEILFGEGLIKVLFATDTFAMGLNMPAKSVVFTATKKYDGIEDRYITSGEYIQMSGRAGRRGIDQKGTVVLLMKEYLPPEVTQSIMVGKADPLTSAFHLTYNMILNLLRQEDINPEYMIEKSFFMFQTLAKLKHCEEKLIATQKLLVIPNEKQIVSYLNAKETVADLHEKLRSLVPNCSLEKFVTEGRMVKAKINGAELEWGMIIRGDFSGWGKRRKVDHLSIIIPCSVREIKNHKKLHPDTHIQLLDKKKLEYVSIVPFALENLCLISTIIIKFKGKRQKALKSIHSQIMSLKNKYTHGLPLMHPQHDMKIHNSEVNKLVRRIEDLERCILRDENEPKFKKMVSRFCNKQERIETTNEIETEINRLKEIIDMEELKKRKNVLKMLDYCDESGVITMKGRVACEINCTDELLITEMIFNGIFNDLRADSCVALMSCFVNGKDYEDVEVSPALKRALLSSSKLDERIKKITLENDLPVDDKRKGLNPSLIPAVQLWCEGSTFIEVAKISKIPEGTLIRCLRRLAELLEEMCKAARNVGNTDLEIRFSEGIRLLKRGIPFAGSLYL